MALPPGRNKVPGWIKMVEGWIRPTGLVFATCDLRGTTQSSCFSKRRFSNPCLEPSCCHPLSYVCVSRPRYVRYVTRLSLLPAHLSIKVLTPVPQNMIIFGDSLYRGDWVKKRSKGWTLTNYDWNPYKVEVWTQTYRRKWRQHREMPATYKPRTAAWDRFFCQGPRKELTLPTPSSQTSSLQNCEKIPFC